MSDDFIILDDFQECVRNTELFQKFEWSTTDITKQGKTILYEGRLYHVETFYNNIGVVATDTVTSISYSTNFGHQGLKEIITDQDRIIFSKCTKLANMLRDKIIKQAAQVRLNKFKIVEEKI